MAGFSIIIPTYNRAQFLRTALKSVQRLRVPAGWEAEILVIDNNSNDTTPLVAEESNRSGPIQVRHMVEKQQGLNHGRNRGLQEAVHEVLVYLDDDMVVDHCWLEAYVEVRHAFAPDCVTGPVKPRYEEPPADWLTSTILDSVNSSYSQKGDTAHIVPPEHAHELPGCNLSVLKSAALEVGGFHPALDRSGAGMLAGGDWEFGERLAVLKKKVVYSPRCSIQHFISKEKTSRAGLRARWKGLGATNGALMRLRGEQVTVTSRLRLFALMQRFFARSWWYQIAGNPKEAFRWELEAMRIRGLIGRVPPGLRPRPEKTSQRVAVPRHGQI